MSLRSSASSTAMEILVRVAIWRSDTPLRSRALRSFPPKFPDPSDPIRRKPSFMLIPVSMVERRQTAAVPRPRRSPVVDG